MKLSDFDYYLPKELIAQYPPKRRDASRMMVLDRKKKTIQHKRFRDIALYLRKGDTMVFNDSKVIPARIILRRETGGKAEIFLLNKIKDNLYEALVRPASKLFPGKKLIWDDGKAIAQIIENRDVGKLVRFANLVNVEKELKKMGQVPLPPYIKRRPEEIDKKRYQTIYARKDGSTASPTAGLHFSKEVLKKIKEKNVKFSYLTLHVSYGTFAPVKVENIKKHKMHKEFFELPKETQDLVKSTKRYGGRVIAVGTTTTRVLENNAKVILKDYQRRTRKDLTGLFIYPPYKFKIVDMLLTNFHLPKSTLLMLVSAFGGKEFVLDAYKEGIKQKYRFFSYGDCMLII